MKRSAGYSIVFLCYFISYSFTGRKNWQSRFVQVNENGSINYSADENGNTIPDFSRVGYYCGDREIPSIAVTRTVSPSENAQEEIQKAIDEVSQMKPDKNGFRGTVLLKKGTYKLPGSIRISASGVVLRGEGNTETGTRLVATTKQQDELIIVSGSGSIAEVAETRSKINDAYVPVGAKSFTIPSSANYKIGDSIIVFRPGTKEWIHDLKMDQIVERQGTKQWQPGEYDLRFERIITKIEGNKIFIDNPIVMAMETKYGGGAVYKYHFNGRISQVGVENLYCESEFETDTSENHAWTAVSFNKVENGWVKELTARYFGYSAVDLENDAR
ncbi:MAG: hypothetical protein ACJ749_16220, partial [Flavisolibacter sp.]